MIQVVKPNTNVRVLAGQCHKLARTAFGAPPREPSAWEAWKNAIGRHTTAHPKNVSVPVWFSHYGTYGNPPQYKNWGHVVVYVPGRGYLSSPGSGFGNKWFKTIAEVEKYFNCKYVGWSEGINGVRVVKKAPKPNPTENPSKSVGGTKVFMIARTINGVATYAITGPGYWNEFTGSTAAGELLKQIRGGGSARALWVSESFWNHCKRASGH